MTLGYGVHYFHGGPFHKQRAPLPLAITATQVFRATGMTGRYVRKVAGNVLEWEPA